MKMYGNNNLDEYAHVYTTESGIFYSDKSLTEKQKKLNGAEYKGMLGDLKEGFEKYEAFSLNQMFEEYVKYKKVEK